MKKSPAVFQKYYFSTFRPILKMFSLFQIGGKQGNIFQGTYVMSKYLCCASIGSKSIFPRTGLMDDHSSGLDNNSSSGNDTAGLLISDV